MDFKFDIDQWVTTPFGKPGIVSWAGIDDGGKIQYCVKCEDSAQWFKESELTEK